MCSVTNQDLYIYLSSTHVLRQETHRLFAGLASFGLRQNSKLLLKVTSISLNKDYQTEEMLKPMKKCTFKN